MEMHLESRPAFRVVGMKYVGHNKHGEIPRMWEAFTGRLGELGGDCHGECYGVCWCEGAPEGFSYIAGMACSDPAPTGMEALELPAAQYAVYAMKWLEQEIGSVWEAAWSDMQQRGLRSDGISFELYPADFQGRPGDPVFLYLPVAG